MSEQQEKGTIQFVVLYRNGIRVLFDIEPQEKDEILAQWTEARRKHVKEGRNVSVRFGDAEFTPGDVVLFAPYEAVFFPELDDEDDDEGGFFSPGPPAGGGGMKIHKIEEAKPVEAPDQPAFVGPDPSAV